MKDLQIDQMNLEQEWLDFLVRLFISLGFEILDEPHPRHLKADVSYRSGDEKVVVEFKLHRSDRVPLALIRNALTTLENIRTESAANGGYLIIPQRLVESHYLPVRTKPHIGLWDLDVLIERTSVFPDLALELAALIRALRVGAEEPPMGAIEIMELGDTTADLPPVGAGTDIANQLEAVPAGKQDGAARTFEMLCERALMLMFDRDLLGWRSQSDIEQGFQRVDIVARLQPVQSAFWQTLSTDFRTRYVVFEFKNYAAPITQDQIYSTEKYLFTSALRSVAVVIAKNGVADSAKRAIRGALREQGKLILCVSMAEFGMMLRGFDVGDNPEEVLIQQRDDLLMSIGR